MEKKEWNHKELLEETKKTENQRRNTYHISLLDNVLQNLPSTDCPIILDIKDEKQIQWSWSEADVSAKQKFRSIALLILPALEEAFEDFKKILEEQKSYKDGEISDPTAVLCSTRLQFFKRCLNHINKMVENTFSDKEHPIANLEYFLSSSLNIAYNTETIFQEEPEISALPDFNELREEISEALSAGEKNSDPRVRNWIFLEEEINQELPKAFQIVRNDKGAAVMKESPEWNEACEADQVKILIWTLEHDIIPAIENGIRNFRKTVSQKSSSIQPLLDTLPIEMRSSLESLIDNIGLLETDISAAKKLLQTENPEAFGKSFREAIRSKEITSELEYNGNLAVKIRNYLLKDLQNILQSLEELVYKENRIKSTPIHFPTLSEVPGIFSIPNLKSDFLASEYLPYEA